MFLIKIFLFILIMTTFCFSWDRVSEKEINSYLDERYLKELQKNSPLNNKQLIQILKEIIASSILYQKNSEYSSKLFIEEKDVTKRVKKTISLLLSIGKNETSYYNYSFSVFSKTYAFGRFQITSHTAAEAFYKLFQDGNLKVSDLKKFQKNKMYKYKKDKKSHYYTILNISKEYQKDYQKFFNKGWLNTYEKRFLENSVNYGYRFNYVMEKLNKKRNIFNEINRKNKYELRWEIYENFFLLFKNPVFQGIISLKVAEIKSQYKDLKLEETSNIIKEILQYYNADTNLIFHKGKTITKAQYYSILGMKIYKKTLIN